jgi:hypothetical protein
LRRNSCDIVFALTSREIKGDLAMKLRLAFFLAFSAAAFPLCADPDIHDTRLLAEPAVSATQIAFIYRETSGLATSIAGTSDA